MSGTISYTGTIASITIATTGDYTFTADGAAGGSASQSNAAGGEGAEVTGTFLLSAGDVIEVLVGGEGGEGRQAAGGGGGTFIYDVTTSTLLEAAGGGGGAGLINPGGSGTATTTAGSGTNGEAAGTAGAGATDSTGGTGGSGTDNGGGGGGGFSGDGGSGTASASGDSGGGGGKSFGDGGAGGAGYTGAGNESGGFGGGGGGDESDGGGGGGYGGGGGGGGFFGSGGGGSSFVNTSASNYVGSASESAGVNSGDGFVTELCYLRGTRILTATGVVAIEDVGIGTRVVTRFGGVRHIKWIGRQSYDSRFLKCSTEKLPVCIHPGALGDDMPARKLFLSPGHSLLLGETLVLASALVNGITVTQRYDDATPAMIDYFQIELESHDCIIAEGVWAETYADAPGLRAQFHNEAEYYALYPDAPPPEELMLCAARPQKGPKLEAALRPVAARAAAAVTPGRFEGWVETISDWRISGWAIDHAHPELPVLLEVVLGEAVIGTVLACELRPDLAEAGIGNGRHAFVFTPLARLRAAVWPEIKLRRACDGAALQLATACQERISASQKPAVMLAAE